MVTQAVEISPPCLSKPRVVIKRNKWHCIIASSLYSLLPFKQTNPEPGKMSESQVCDKQFLFFSADRKPVCPLSLPASPIGSLALIYFPPVSPSALCCYRTVYSFTLKMDTSFSSETLVNINNYHTTRRHIPEEYSSSRCNF